MFSASRRAKSILVAGVYGKKPFLFCASIGSHSQYDRGSLAVFDAASAFSLIALNPRPGGSIILFCEPPMDTSTSHSSWRKSIDASDEMTSTSNRAGCCARFIAARTAFTELVTPDDVSLCTTQTALIL